MRRYAKAPSSGSGTQRVGGCSRLPLGLLTVLVAALTLSAGASAATVQTHPYIGLLTPPAIATPNGPFKPQALAVNQTTGNLYVVDAENDVIDIFKPSGAFLGTIDGSSTPEGHFTFKPLPGNNPLTGSATPIAIDNSGGPTNGRIYVKESDEEPCYHCDTLKRPIVALSPSGAYLFEVVGYHRPSGLDVDSNGALVTSADGRPGGPSETGYFIDFYPDPGSSEIPSQEINVDHSFGDIGLGDIALDSHDEIYATSSSASRLAAVDRSGSLRWVAGSSGTDSAVDVDRSTDAVYALEGGDDPGASFVSRYDTDGHLQESFGLSILPAVHNGSLGPRSLAVADGGKVYVGDLSKGAVEVFGPQATATAPDATAGAADAPATGSGDLSLLATGSGDIPGSPYEKIENLTTDTGTFSVGESISGAGIPAGTTITAVHPGTLILSRIPTEAGTGVSLVSGSKTVANFNPTSGGVAVGDAAYGPGIPEGTSITAVGPGTLTLSRGATEAGTGVSLSTVDTTATLNGTVNPQGVPASWRFQFRRHGSRIWTSTALQDAGSGSSDLSVASLPEPQSRPGLGPGGFAM